jgi:hypothetical protein
MSFAGTDVSVLIIRKFSLIRKNPLPATGVVLAGFSKSHAMLARIFRVFGRLHQFFKKPYFFVVE